MSKSKDNSYKIIVLGEAGVGKSSLLRRYTQGTFSSRTTTTVGVDRVPASIYVDNEELQFQVLDTSGSIGFRGLINSYMTNVDAVVFMYDISNKESFASLPLWTTLLKSSATPNNLTKILVGNKRDLATDRRQVKFKNAKNYAEFEGMISMEISVKEEESVDLVFQCIARELKLKRQLADHGLTNPSSCRIEKRFQHPVNHFTTGERSPKQFVRKISYLLSAKKLSKSQSYQQQHLQSQRKDSAPTGEIYSTRLFSVDKNTEEKRYLLW